MQYLTIWDLFLTPLYLIVLNFLAVRHRNKHYPKSHPLHAYYLPGLYVKFFGAIFIALIYQYYYGGGDTFAYFNHSQIINSSLDESFSVWLKLILRTPVENDIQLYKYVSQFHWYHDPSTYTVASIGAVLGLLNGTTYLPIALLFAYISYTGIWAMYKTFAGLYPHLTRQLAFAFLFIPSTFVWGSAIFKDTVCMFGLGWMMYCTFRIFVNRDFSLRNLVMLVISFYLVATIKMYILLAFIPALTLWLMMTYSHRIVNSGLRILMNIFLVVLIAGSFFFFMQRFADELNKYSLDRIAKTAEVTRGWIQYASEAEGGSSYDLGSFDPSFVGMLSKFPQAVIVTLFRPFIWEVNKVIVALSALESLLFLFFTLKLFFDTRGKFIGMILKDPNVVFCLVFSVVFAFAVGISTYNFGALSRYKIPCLPFYTAFLIIMIYKYRPHQAKAIRTSPKKPVHLPEYYNSR